ncbi:hypothetical protein G4Y79_05725 [Phototrophicus methaneseepsis]|uniref:DUF4352 domain-containing protein n=1 Tax=Phototrophicus methaneseepsis TaxID=2710758 RepID=A0A7S8IFR3_9CHLR|nr:hypothetical protein [Phototrophicus methaneseepsis]QPC83877.1 hypothetical protein G4Y79_05725 [Phototrophicus methaneseepsis]
MMRISGRWLVISLLLLLLPNSIDAQTVDCSARAINARLDAAYERYHHNRSTVDAVEARDQLLTFQSDLLSIISACPPEVVEDLAVATELPTATATLTQTPTETVTPLPSETPTLTSTPTVTPIPTEAPTETAFPTDTTVPTTAPTEAPSEAPTIENAADATLESGLLLQIERLIRPADAQILGANRYNTVPGSGMHYMMVVVAATCGAESETACDVTPFHFRLSTGSGTFDPPFVVYDDELDTRLEPGQSASGVVTFLLPENAANMRLLYYPQTIYGDAAPSTYELGQ